MEAKSRIHLYNTFWGREGREREGIEGDFARVEAKYPFMKRLRRNIKLQTYFHWLPRVSVTQKGRMVLHNHWIFGLGNERKEGKKLIYVRKFIRKLKQSNKVYLQEKSVCYLFFCPLPRQTRPK